MASLDDILTTQKNGVVAISTIGQIFQRYIGVLTSQTVTTSTLIFAGSGRLVNFSIVVKGSTNGKIHNSATVAGITAANALCAVPAPSTTGDAPYAGIGVYPANLIFTNGLVIVPGTGQSVNVTYSIGA
jgi:hypothetical protein